MSRDASAAALAQAVGPVLEALRGAVSSSVASVASAAAMQTSLQQAASSAAAAAPRAEAPSFRFDQMMWAVPTVAAVAPDRSWERIGGLAAYFARMQSFCGAACQHGDAFWVAMQETVWFCTANGYSLPRARGC